MNQSSKKLLIDLGNSRLKWRLAGTAGLGEPHSVSHAEILAAAPLFEDWRALETPESIVCASVAAVEVKQSLFGILHNLWPQTACRQVRAEAEAYGVRNAYAEPETLGVDRWLGLIAARRHYPGSCCIADCGTAVTFDALDAEGGHLGGLICPGLRVMRQALAANTAALNIAPRANDALLAADTAAALHNGALYAAAGFIETAYRRLAHPGRLILTGGDAGLIAEKLEIPFILDTDLLFKGLQNY